MVTECKRHNGQRGRACVQQDGWVEHANARTAMTNICSAKPVCSPRMKKRFFSSSTDTSRSFSLPIPSSTVAVGPEWSKMAESAALEWPLHRSARLSGAARRALRRHRSRAGALPRGHFDHCCRAFDLDRALVEAEVGGQQRCAGLAQRAVVVLGWRVPVLAPPSRAGRPSSRHPSKPSFWWELA